ncbi:hypothetical protein, partial [Pseudoalteromonas citrea]|uniref:hypothetical protein n=1 Tax=Pseudoalteromonas citrea TaxID=43655 RepID=UPI001BB2332D
WPSLYKNGQKNINELCNQSTALVYLYSQETTAAHKPLKAKIQTEDARLEIAASIAGPVVLG